MVLQAPGALFLLFREEHKHSVQIKPLHCTVEIEHSVPDVRWPLPVISVLKQRWARLLSLQTAAQGEWPGRSYSTTREKQFQGKSGPTCCSTATTHTLPCMLRWQQTMSLNAQPWELWFCSPPQNVSTLHVQYKTNDQNCHRGTKLPNVCLKISVIFWKRLQVKFLLMTMFLPSDHAGTIQLVFALLWRDGSHSSTWDWNNDKTCAPLNLYKVLN